MTTTNYEQVPVRDIAKGDLVFLSGKVRKIIQDPRPADLIHIVAEGDSPGSAIPFRLDPTWSVNRHHHPTTEVPVFLTEKQVREFRAGSAGARLDIIRQVREALDSTHPEPAKPYSPKVGDWVTVTYLPGKPVGADWNGLGVVRQLTGYVYVEMRNGLAFHGKTGAFDKKDISPAEAPVLRVGAIVRRTRETDPAYGRIGLGVVVSIIDRGTAREGADVRSDKNGIISHWSRKNFEVVG